MTEKGHSILGTAFTAAAAVAFMTPMIVHCPPAGLIASFAASYVALLLGEDQFDKAKAVKHAGSKPRP